MLYAVDVHEGVYCYIELERNAVVPLVFVGVQLGCTIKGRIESMGV